MNHISLDSILVPVQFQNEQLQDLAMAFVTMERNVGESRRLPDFKFPPRYVESQQTPSPEQRISRQPPAFGFPLHALPRNPSPSPVHMPEITSPLTPLSPPGSRAAPRSTFLIIPLEIRLQIYKHVLAIHPIHHAHLAPLAPPTSFSGMNTMEFHTTMLAHSSSSLPSSTPVSLETEVRTLITKLAPSVQDEQKINALYPISSPTSILTPGSKQHRIQGKIPTALLVSCKQVFEECRMIPWEANTFTFINWFWSGVYASRQFTRGLRGWQAEGMRWVGVEVLGRDLKVDVMGKVGGGVSSSLEDGVEKAQGEWWELCTLWKNVWGVRLGVKGSVGPEMKTVSADEGWNGELGDASTIPAPSVEDKGILDINQPWVLGGLLQMKQLRWIELEIEDEDVDRETKLQFCVDLESALNSSTESHKSPNSKSKQKEEEPSRSSVKVIFIERLKAPSPVSAKSDFTYYGGEPPAPGNDSIWGLDM